MSSKQQGQPHHRCGPRGTAGTGFLPRVIAVAVTAFAVAAVVVVSVSVASEAAAAPHAGAEMQFRHR
ncbi:hypothetical protein HK405_007902, partial [Cladochytrium tenue]